jgi:hypothetical protein
MGHRIKFGQQADEERSGYDIVTDKIWDNFNKGVRNFKDRQQRGHMLIFCGSDNGRTSGQDTSRTQGMMSKLEDINRYMHASNCGCRRRSANG